MGNKPDQFVRIQFGNNFISLLYRRTLPRTVGDDTKMIWRHIFVKMRECDKRKRNRKFLKAKKNRKVDDVKRADSEVEMMNIKQC